MVMKRIVLFLSGILLYFIGFSQEAKVASFEHKPNSLIAVQAKVLDLNGNSCALVIVQILDDNPTFSGNVIKSYRNGNNEYYVWMSEKSRNLKITPSKALGLTVKFADYGIQDLKGKSVYELKINLPTSTSKKVETQYLVLKCDVPGAAVYLDGANSSEPFENGMYKKTLPLGNHDYKVIAPGYKDYIGKVTLTSTGREEVSIDLRSTRSVITFVVDDPMANIYINDEYKGRGKWSGPLSEGNYLVEVRKRGCKSVQKNVKIEEGTEIVKLDSPKPYVGSLKVDCNVLDAEIIIDGELSDKLTPAIISDIPVGDYYVTLRKEGYSNATTSVSILDEQETPISLTLTKLTEKEIKEIEKLKIQDSIYEAKRMNRTIGGNQTAEVVEKDIVVADSISVVEEITTKKKRRKKTFWTFDIGSDYVKPAELHEMFLASPDVATNLYGVTFGRVKTIGWYVSLMSNLGTRGLFGDTYPQYDNETTFFSKYNSERTILSGSVGLMVRPFKPLALKFGAGYRYDYLFYSGENGQSYVANNSSDLEFNIGLQFILWYFTFSIDAVSTLSNFNENGFVEYTGGRIGIGFSF